MNISDGCVRVAELFSHAEAIIESREREKPDLWAITAFSRHQVFELLGLVRIAADGRDLQIDPVALLESAADAAEDLDVSADDLGWRRSLAEALRAVLADVRMVCGACDI